MAKRPPKRTAVENGVAGRVEVPIPRGTPRYEFIVDDATMESLAQGVCPEPLARQCHGLLSWKREGQRVAARGLPRRGLKPYAVIER
jgi:hypothetical protein